MASQTAADQPTLNQPTEIVKTTGEPVAESPTTSFGRMSGISETDQRYDA
jgi:hypothetical protein